MCDVRDAYNAVVELFTQYPEMFQVLKLYSFDINNKGGFRGNNAHGGYCTFSYLDSPATTSAVTYGVQTSCNTGNYVINNYYGSGPCTSFLTVMEVSA